jgi:hypothetical protein
MVIIFIPSLKSSVSLFGLVAPLLGIVQILYLHFSPIYRFTHKISNYFARSSFEWSYGLCFRVNNDENESNEITNSAITNKISNSQNGEYLITDLKDHSLEFETPGRFSTKYKIVYSEDLEEFTDIMITVRDRGSFVGMKNAWSNFVENANIIKNSFEMPTNNQYSANISVDKKQVEYLLERPVFGNVTNIKTTFKTKRDGAAGMVLLQNNRLSISSENEKLLGKILSEITIRK